MVRRILAFLSGDMASAEGLGQLPEVPRVEWIDAAVDAENSAIVDYALEAALRSANDATASVKGIQDKAAGLLTLLVGVVPLLIAATTLSLASTAGGLARWVALALFVAAACALIGAIVMAAIATGLSLGGGLNVARLQPGEEPSLASLKGGEADAWHHAAMLAMEAATRKARDLFHARQLVLWTLTLSILGTLVLLVSVRGDVRTLDTSPPPSPSTAPQSAP